MGLQDLEADARGSSHVEPSIERLSASLMEDRVSCLHQASGVLMGFIG